MKFLDKEKSLLYLLGILFIALMFNLGVFSWEGKIGLSEIINIALALLTYFAVRLSSKATESAKISAEASKESIKSIETQTNLMKIDVTNTHEPLLIPISREYLLPAISFNQTYLDLENLDFEIEIVNVSQGNAYMISSWLEIDIEDLIKIYDKKTSPGSYGEFFEHSYELNFTSKEQKSNYIETTIYPDDESYERKEDDVIKDHVANFFDRNEPIIKSGQTLKVDTPQYILRVLLDLIYRALYQDINHYIENKIIKLNIKFKTREQLENEDVTVRIYQLKVSRVVYVIGSLKLRNKPKPIQSSLKVVLSYKFLNEIQYTEHESFY